MNNNKILEHIKSIISRNDLNIAVYLFENRRTKNNPFIVYKMLFDNSIETSIKGLLIENIDDFIKLQEDMENDKIPEYNPDEEQEIFKVEVGKINIISMIKPYLIEEQNPEIISSNKRITDKNKIKAWIVKVEYEEKGSTKQYFFFQKFLKSQFLQSKKMFFVLEQAEFKLLNRDILAMNDKFEVILAEDILISKNLKAFEYVFDFVEHYVKGSKELLIELTKNNLFSFQDDQKDRFLKKIKSSKRFAYKLYSAKQNKYYENININKLNKLIEDQDLNIKIADNKIVVNENTDLNHLIRILNDDYEQSLITDNKYISHKKEKV